MLSSLLQKAGLRPGLALHSAIPKVLMAAVIAGGGGIMLSAGSAKAAPTYECTPIDPGGPGGFVSVAFASLIKNDTIACGDKLFTIGDFDFKGATGNAVFEWIQTDPPPGYEGDKFSVNLLFVPSITGSATPITGTFDYTLSITDPAYQFANVQLDSAVAVSENPLSPGDTTVTKLVNGLPILTSTNGARVGPIALSLPSPITVSNSWTVAQFDVLTSVKDTYQQQRVPGPLPVLGAGMAFGFSRKLRSRIKASAKA